MKLLVILAGIYAGVEGLMRVMGRPRAFWVSQGVGLLGAMVEVLLVVAALLGPERPGLPAPLLVVLAAGVYALGGLQVTHAVGRARRQQDSQAHRLYMYLKTHEVSESQNRRGEEIALADEDPGPFHLG